MRVCRVWCGDRGSVSFNMRCSGGEEPAEAGRVTGSRVMPSRCKLQWNSTPAERKRRNRMDYKGGDKAPEPLPVKEASPPSLPSNSSTSEEHTHPPELNRRIKPSASPP